MRALRLSIGFAKRPVGLALAVALLCGVTGAARAQGGLFELFGHAFGGGGDSQPAAEPDMVMPGAPPLTVRAHKRKHRPLASRSGGGNGGRYNVADLKSVTIYTDRTLLRGDAVMTPNGLKIFVGSSSWPYRDGDFVAIADSGRLPPVVRKELTAINDASGPRFDR